MHNVPFLVEVDMLKYMFMVDGGFGMRYFVEISNFTLRLNNKLNTELQNCYKLNIETWDGEFNLMLSSSRINAKTCFIPSIISC